MQINNNSKTVASSSKDKYSNQKYSLNNFDHNHKNDIKPQRYAKNEVNCFSKPKKQENKNVENATNIVKSFLAVVSTVLVAMFGVSTFTTNIKATLDFLEVYDNAVYYAISLTNYEEGKDNCYVNLYNDFTNRIFEISDNYSEGYFENLQPNMYYTFAVKVGNTVIMEKTIYTEFIRQQETSRPGNDYNPKEGYYNSDDDSGYDKYKEYEDRKDDYLDDEEQNYIDNENNDETPSNQEEQDDYETDNDNFEENDQNNYFEDDEDLDNDDDLDDDLDDNPNDYNEENGKLSNYDKNNSSDVEDENNDNNTNNNSAVDGN